MESEQQLEIFAAADGDACLGRRTDGRVVLVHGPTVPGDTVTALPLGKGGRLPRYRLMKMVEPAANRIDPVCSHFGSCGGCKWMSLPAADETAIKQQRWRDVLERVAGIQEPPLAPLVSAAHRTGYRNKLELVPLSAEERWGMHGFGRSDTLVPVDACHLAHPALNHALLRLDDTPGITQTMSRTTLRLHRDAETVIVLHGTKPPDPADLRRMDWAAGVWWQPAKTAPARHLRGVRLVEQPQAGITFHLLPTAFFQVNPEQTEVLVHLVRSAVNERTPTRVADLFCGAGLFAATLAAENRVVTGYDWAGDGLMSWETTREKLPPDHPARATDCNEADLTGGLPDFARTCDVVVVDPPRAGMSAQLVDDLCGAEFRRLIYVSCHPATMARDLKRFLQHPDLSLTRVTPVDCFPCTAHVEGVAIVDRISAS